MPRPLAIAATALSLSLLASAAHARTENQSWNRDFQVSRHPTVRIDTEDARVVVHSWKEPRVAVRVESRGQATPGGQ